MVARRHVDHPLDVETKRGLVNVEAPPLVAEPARQTCRKHLKPAGLLVFSGDHYTWQSLHVAGVFGKCRAKPGGY